jgi:hypothetical protein
MVCWKPSGIFGIILVNFLTSTGHGADVIKLDKGEPAV